MPILMDDEKLLLIRNYDLWANLTDDEYEELDLIHNFKVARQGEYIYFEKQFLGKLYFLKDGFIRIGYIDENGNEVIREILQKGEVFGQFTLIKNNLRGEFAKAYKSDVSLCAFEIEDFERILARKPEIAIHFSKLIGQKLRNTENRVLDLLHKDVRSRLLSYMYQLAVQNGYNGNDHSFSIDNFLTHEDIARLIGSSRQSVTTLINDYEKEGLLSFTRQQIILHDVKKISNTLNVL
jgi:CRP/FNR family transcriptional regulator, cyclic AMP receptor protein